MTQLPPETFSGKRGAWPGVSDMADEKLRQDGWDERKGNCGVCPAGCWVKVGLGDGKPETVAADDDHAFGMLCRRRAYAANPWWLPWISAGSHSRPVLPVRPDLRTPHALTTMGLSREQAHRGHSTGRGRNAAGEA